MYKIKEYVYGSYEMVGVSQKTYRTIAEAKKALSENYEDIPLFGNLAGLTGNDFFYHKIVKI